MALDGSLHPSLSFPIMESSVEPLELALVCSNGSSDGIPSDIHRPGRTVRKIPDSAGSKLDAIISRSAERVGYGPRVTAQRIRARSDVLHPPGRWCYVCFGPRDTRKIDESPSRIEQQRRKAEQDVRRLLKYVKYVFCYVHCSSSYP